MKLYPFGRFSLWIPDDHKVIEIHRANSFYDRLVFMIMKPLLDNSRGAIVDIGANVGDTAAQFRSVCENPILCVEGFAEYASLLITNAKRIGGLIQVVDRFAIPAKMVDSVFEFVRDPGSGHLSSSTANERTVASEKYIGVAEILEAAHTLANGAPPALVKTDTDGLDPYLLEDLLPRVSCPVFFECDTIRYLDQGSSPWPELFRHFDDLQSSAVVFDNHGLPMMCLAGKVGERLRDLSGYLHLQQAVGSVRSHYLDVLWFPVGCRDAFDRVSQLLRDDWLRPYRF